MLITELTMAIIMIRLSSFYDVKDIPPTA